MREFVVKVPEKKASFFLELIGSLGFTEAKEMGHINDIEISEEHKNLVRKRIQSAKPADILDWDIAKNKIKVG